MRSILRTLPIRWQITMLHTTILALVLAAGGALLWQTQRKFQLDSLITRHTTEARALIPEEINARVKDLLFSPPPLDRAKLKDLYPQIIAEIFPPNQDPIASYKKLGLLNPKLISKLTSPDTDALASKKLAATLAQLGPDDLFPPDANPADIGKRLAELSPTLGDQLFDAQLLDQTALRKWTEGLVQQLGTKDRGVVILALDGAVLAQSSLGPPCSPPAYVSKDALAANAGNGFFKRLRMTQYLDQVEKGQLTLLLPVIWQKDRPLALAQICVPTDSIDASLNQLAASLVVGWVLVVGVATALGVTATRRVLRPLDQVVAATGRIAAGGGVQARLRIAMICSALKVSGAPERGASAKTVAIAAGRVRASASAAASTSSAAAQLLRHKGTVVGEQPS